MGKILRMSKQEFKESQIWFYHNQMIMNENEGMRDEIGKILLGFLDTDKDILKYIDSRILSIDFGGYDPFLKQLLEKVSNETKLKILGKSLDKFAKFVEEDEIKKLKPEHVSEYSLTYLIMNGYADRKFIDAAIQGYEKHRHSVVISCAVEHGVMAKTFETLKKYRFLDGSSILYFGPYTEDQILEILSVMSPTKYYSYDYFVKKFIEKGWLEKSEKIYDFLIKHDTTLYSLLPDDKITSEMVRKSFESGDHDECEKLLKKVDKVEEDDAVWCIDKIYFGNEDLVLKILDKTESISKSNFLKCIKRSGTTSYDIVLDKLCELYRIGILMEELKPYGLAAKLMAEQSKGKNY